MHPKYAESAARLRAWAQEREDVRAVVLLGSQIRQKQAGDEWSDLDVLLLVDDPDPYLRGDAWLAFLGQPVLAVGEETPLDWLGLTWAVKRVVFADNRALDFSILPAARQADVLALNAEIHMHGFEVLYAADPAALEAEIRAGLAGVNAPAAATLGQAEMERLVDSLFFQLIWAGKKIRRGEVWTAVSAINQLVSGPLLRLIEARAALDAAHSSPIRYEGRFLEDRLPPWLAEELPECFAKYDPADAMRTIGHLIEIIGRLAGEIAGASGYEHERGKCEQVRALYLDLLG